MRGGGEETGARDGTGWGLAGSLGARWRCCRRAFMQGVARAQAICSTEHSLKPRFAGMHHLAAG